MIDWPTVFALACALTGTVLASVAAIRGRPVRSQIAERHHELWLQIGLGFWALDQFHSTIARLIREGQLVGPNGQLMSQVDAAMENARSTVSIVHNALRDPKLVDLSHAEHVAGSANMLTAIALVLVTIGLTVQISSKFM